MFTTAFGLYSATASLTTNATIGTSGMIVYEPGPSISPLHVEGGKILDANNTEVLLKGINFETWIYDFDDGIENANLCNSAR